KLVQPESSSQPRIPFAKPEISAEAQAASARVLASGWITTGPEVVEFERDFAALVGAEHAIAVSSCTAAIEIALRALRLPRGAKVGTDWVGTRSAATCFSFYATKNLPIGEGGMITTDDSDVAAYARQVRIHGMSHDAWKRYLPGAGWRYGVEVAGIKANMTDV